jgi:integrase
MALSAKGVANLKTPGRYRDSEVKGLYLQVTNASNRSWIFRFEREGRERWMGLGPLHTISLKEAREKAREARRALIDGIDPLEARREARAARAARAAKTLTFAEAAQRYFDAHEKKWRNNKHRAQFLSTLTTYAFPHFGKLSVAAIDTGLVLKALEPIWLTKTETASRVRMRIEAVLDWATVRGYRAGDNPARWNGHIGEVLPKRGAIAKVTHLAAMPIDELPAFMVELRAVGGVAARALEFCILTAARTGEVIGARWDEIDLAEATWTVPAGRMKGSREHRSPLSSRAVELLRSLPREDGNPFVFIGPRARLGFSDLAMARVLKRMERRDITVHGFRSTFRDWSAERTNFQNHVIEMALAHKISSAVEAAYRRGDLLAKRKQLMEAWAGYCGGAPVVGTVAVLRGGK